MKNNIEKIVETLLIKNRIGNYDKKDLELQLQIHPNYPSFQSITDTLDYFDIENIAVEVPKDALEQLPSSFISLISKEGHEEIVVVLRKKNSIELKHTSLSKTSYSIEEFNTIWVPKVIAVDYNANKTRVNHRSFVQRFLGIMVLVSLIAVFAMRSWSLYEILFLILSITGATLSILALRESIGIQSQTIHQFCTTVGNTNCGDVINNNSGKLFKGFTLADAGIAFFGSILLYQIFFGYTSVLLIPTALGIPFVIYSIYSQGVIIKKWCAICMAMGLVSIALASIAIISLPLLIDIRMLPELLLLSSLFTVTYLFTKEHLVSSQSLKNDNRKLNQFKRDGQIFDHLLGTSQQVMDTATFTNEIILGNPDSHFKIISYTNPMCGYCKEAFEAYARVIRTMGDKLQIVIRLGVKLDDQNAQPTQIALRLLEIYHQQGQENCIAAYADWFADRTYSKWIKKYNKPSNSPLHKEVLHKQLEWSKKNGIAYTPATIINTRSYPKKYSYEEFFHFISVQLDDYLESTSEKGNTVEA
ncbi:thioredoxin domain-containing protein [Aquimarina sp. U1-2]|uniref:vitamin K epoxide reductase family protein n=1 Tax=Aquimarina sp. U1-2 TaxID=2823141 RepID=UPI001AEC9FCA|nr:vitamin K epoxide reductase family protein [Aquimarina sp. U1-2]MBP2832581.1 thioredoxin domain-containing protein [Aquimarina sp. U1-2]